MCIQQSMHCATNWIFSPLLAANVYGGADIASVVIASHGGANVVTPVVALDGVEDVALNGVVVDVASVMCMGVLPSRMEPSYWST